MRYFKWYRTTLLAMTTCLCLYCEPESGNQQNSRIIGHWDLQQALRNGKPATSLEDIFFEFYENGSIKTNFNLSGETETGTFAISKDNVLQQEGGLNLDYIIEELNDSILILSTELQESAFKLLLNRKNLEE